MDLLESTANGVVGEPMDGLGNPWPAWPAFSRGVRRRTQDRLGFCSHRRWDPVCGWCEGCGYSRMELLMAGDLAPLVFDWRCRPVFGPRGLGIISGITG